MLARWQHQTDQVLLAKLSVLRDVAQLARSPAVRLFLAQRHLTGLLRAAGPEQEGKAPPLHLRLVLTELGLGHVWPGKVKVAACHPAEGRWSRAPYRP